MVEIDEDALYGFPCEFPVKAIGPDTEDFELRVVTIVRRHAPDLGEGAVTRRPSKGGRYRSVTVTITARSKAQLDALYRELNAEQQVHLTL